MDTPQSDPAALHVILGAGQIGARLAELLLANGHRVRSVRLGKGGGSNPKIERLSGDITDLSFAKKATEGAAVVYDCMNPPYDKWPELLLPMARGALHGATQAGAKLVALDCLYMYGRPNGPMTEETPFAPCSKKGALRVELSNLRLEAHERGDLAVSIGRASDFFGPDLQFSCWNDRFFQRLYDGKPGECMGDPDLLHSYTFADDIAAALSTLGKHDRALGRVWHLPTPPAESTRALTSRLGHALGIDAKITRLPRWQLKLAGLFSPFMREVAEMAYQWDIPYVLDDFDFRSSFGLTPTPIDDAVRATATWAQAKFGKKER